MERVNFDEVFRKFLEHRYSPSDDSFWAPQIGRYHASDMGKCVRSIYYKHVYGSKTNPGSYSNFHLGNRIEYIAQEALAHYFGWHYVKNSFRIRLDYRDFEIVGETDLLLLNNNFELETMFEIKSIKSLGYVRRKANDNNIMQVHAYMKALKLNYCYIVYIQKSDMDVIGHLIEFDDQLYEEGLERLNLLHSCLVEENPPDPVPYMDRECGWCSYRPVCPGSK